MEEACMFLQQLGCCPNCIAIFNNEKCNFTSDLDSTNADSEKSTNGIESANGNDAKRCKNSICTSCLGLFTEGMSSSIVQKMKDAIISAEYDISGFGLNLSLPVSVGVRVQSIWSKLLHKYPDFPSQHSNEHLTVLKESWRTEMGNRLSKAIGLQFIIGQNIDFCLNITPSYLNDKEDCLILECLCKEKFQQRKRERKKFNEGIFTRQVVIDVFKDIKPSQFVELCPDYPKEPSYCLEFNNLVCHHTATFMAGRYNKYSRELSQTPWLVEGERRMLSSVQELICEQINKKIRADSTKFSSSGREDVDVRCLGKGRPFVIEFVNPHRINLLPEEVSKLQNEVNTSTDLVSIHDLQVVSKTEISNLKQGEVEKTKSYMALCFVKGGYNPDILSKLENMSEFELQQKTPLRVLHRRPLAVRPRYIHSISASPIDDHYFKLNLTTQAGTYVKEFVHGDFGRTTPNLRKLLDIDVDIIALDVVNVQLDWPPCLPN